MRPKGSLSRRSTFLLVTLIVAVSAIAATAYTLWRGRAEAINLQLDAAARYARAFEDHLTQTFNVIDLTLANVANEGRASAALADALRHAPYLRSLALLDATGSIVASSNPRNLGVRIVRDDFLPATPEPSAILRAGPPWVGRDFHDGRPVTVAQPTTPDALSMIPVLRDIALGNDRWTTLLAAVNTDYFLNHYERSVAAGTGVVELLRYDGIVLLSTDEKQKPGALSRGVGRIAREEFGQFEQQLDDGRAVLTAYRASRTYPFLIVVHLEKQSSLAGWRREAVHTLAVVSIVLLAALALAGLYFVYTERVALQHDTDVDQLRLRGAALEAAANSIIITDQAGKITWANHAFCAQSGYTIDETLGRNLQDLIKSGLQPPERYHDLWNTILSGKVWRGEFTNRRKDGTFYREEQTITPVRDEGGAIRHFIAVKQDITERKQAEEKMEALSRQQVVVQESARRRLSGELHDRTSPNLAAIGVNLDIITAIMADEQSPIPVLSARLDDVRALIEDTTASIREICSDLRPPILDYAGLAAALESYVKQFHRRTSIAVRIDCAHPAVRLAPALESVLFRVVQEALTNCAKHSRAKSIVIRLSLEGQPVALTVSDDGIGFDPDLLGKTSHTSGLGILNMREMSEFSGGQFTLESIPGKGTRIKVEIHSMEGQG
jgi:PAS domain S-box-containing protein